MATARNLDRRGNAQKARQGLAVVEREQLFGKGRADKYAQPNQTK